MDDYSRYIISLDQQTEKELVYAARKNIKDESVQTTPQNIR